MEEKMIRRGVLHYILSFVVLSAALWVIVTTVMAVFFAYSPVPYSDQWAEVTPSDYWSHLFAQHNEHRIAVPRLFFLVDAFLFKGSNVFNMACIQVIQAVHAALLLVLARRSGLDDRATMLWSAGVLLVFLFWGYQLENFSWGFQVQFVGVYTAATAAFAALALGVGPLSGLALAVFCAAVAVYSMANGVLVPVLLVPMAVWLRRPWPHVATLVLACAVLVGAYMSGYSRPGGHADPKEVIWHADLVASYTLTYLGAPLARLLNDGGSAANPEQAVTLLPAAMVIGGLGVLLLAGAGLRLRPLRAPSHPARVALVATMLFVAATAFITSLGRVHLPIYQAMSQRYGAGAVVFWSAGALLLLSLLPAGWWRRAWMVPMTVLVLLIARTQPAIMAEAKAVGTSRDDTETALLSGALDTDILQRLYPVPAHLADPIRRLREARLSVFAEDWAAWQGTPLASHVRLEASDACTGFFDAVSPAMTLGQPGWRAGGWAWDRKAERVPARIVIADDAGMVVGYALTGVPRPDVRQALQNDRANSAGWRGHLSVNGSATATAYALTDDGRAACPLGSPQTVDVHEVPRFAPMAQAGRPVAMESPAIEGHWGADAFSPAVGPVPVEGSVYASWTGDDAHTGWLHWRSGPLDGARTLLIPVVAGPRPEGLALKLVDPATGRVLSRLSAIGLTSWKLWEVALPADGSVAAVEIQAEDLGRDWGQWLAVGQPHTPL